MYRRLYPWMFLLAGVLLGMVAAGRMSLRAQDRGKAPSKEAVRPQDEVPGRTTEEVRVPTADTNAPAGREPARASGQASVQEVLLRPYHFPFNRPTTLAQVCLHLKQTLGVPVVLDVAAMERQDVEADDTVQLELDGVRLKTGLKLLLDQVDMTYHVVAEDNLLIITDRQGSDDPLERIWSELRTLHRDLHEVQDAVDDLTDALYGEDEEGPQVRKPTIVEEKPDHEHDAPDAPKGGAKEPTEAAPDAARPRTPSRPGRSGTPNQPRGSRPSPLRVPLSGPAGRYVTSSK